MKNPPINGAVIVETLGKTTGTEVYKGPTRTSATYKVDAPVFKNGFNPRKVVFFGEEVKIYAKNLTVTIHATGLVSTEAVDTWNANEVSNCKKIQADLDTYNLREYNKHVTKG